MKVRWSFDNDKTLLDLMAEGKPLAEVAEAMDRSYDAVTSRVKWLRNHGVPIPKHYHECSHLNALKDYAKKLNAPKVTAGTIETWGLKAA